ncbi:hypothetical protein [Moorena sp. SIOASIH]|uniref:hypothetical protein n=1 Tax=Moorena sp. SIOASIH TaxID=2607817 RepID=UPI0025EA8EBA|nr:hypothetical protein [Moorena sp. SIOASIH]
MDELTIKVVGYTERLSEIKLIMVQVFQFEQGVAADLEFDGKDEIAKHLSIGEFVRVAWPFA